MKPAAWALLGFWVLMLSWMFYAVNQPLAPLPSEGTERARQENLWMGQKRAY